MKAFTNFIKFFEVPQKSVKIKIQVNFFKNPESGWEGLKIECLLFLERLKASNLRLTVPINSIKQRCIKNPIKDL